MSLLDMFHTGPSEKEKAEARAFKNALKYGTDFGKTYIDAKKRYDEAWEAKGVAKKAAEKAIAKYRGIKFKKTWGNWSSIYVREHHNCKKSPLGVCVTMHEYGSKNPNKDDPQNCFYCNKEFK